METYIVNFLITVGVWGTLCFVAYYHVPVYKKIAPWVIFALCAVFGAVAGYIAALNQVSPAVVAAVPQEAKRLAYDAVEANRISGWWLLISFGTICLAISLLKLDTWGVTLAKRDQPAPPPAPPPSTAQERWWSLDDGRK